MATYEIPEEFKLDDYPFELRGQVSRYLNTHFGKFTIPQIAKALGVEEKKVAWVLSNLCELTSPEVVVGTDEGKEYWAKSLKMKKNCPKTPFTDTTIFYGRIMG